MLCTFAGMSANAEEDEDPRIAEIMAVVADYNATHGGTGSLDASFKSERDYLVCTITGEVTGATKGITFPIHCQLQWNATLTGETSGEPMLKSPSSVGIWSGEIKTNGIAVESRDFSIFEGAAVSGDIHAHLIIIHGGTVVGDGFAEDPYGGSGSLIMLGGVFTGAIYCSGSVSISDNAVANVTDLTAESVVVSGKAQLHFIDNAIAIISGDTYISIRTKITGKNAKTFIEKATLEYSRVYYPLKFLEAVPIVQFLLRWLFFSKAMFG